MMPDVSSRHHWGHIPQLNDLVSPRRQQPSPGRIEMHVHNVVFAVVEGGRGRTLFLRDGLVAAVAHPHRKLEAHARDGGAPGAALATHGLPALAAVVLPEANLLTVPHLLEVPEERLLTLLAGVAVQPLRGLLPLHVHVPDDDPTVAATGDELPRVLRVAKGLDSVIVSLELDGCPSSPTDVPHDDRVVGAAGEQHPPARVPAESSHPTPDCLVSWK